MKETFITAVLVLMTLGLLIGQTNPSAQAIPYAQDFSTLAHASTTYPAGWQGWTISTSPGSSFNTAAPTADRAMIASSAANTTSGNVHNYNGKIGFLNGSSLDLGLVLAISTSGFTSVQVTYDIMTIRNPYDGSSNTRINEVTLQYRIGTSGAFTTLTGIEYQNNTITQTSAITTPQNSLNKAITLPSACDNQSVVQLRWASRQVSGGGSRPSFAVDAISVTGTSSGNIPPAITSVSQTPASGITSLNTVNVSATVTDTDGTISVVELKWGTSTGSYPHTINMSTAKGVYTTDSPIPAQSIGTTVYYTIEATDNDDDTTISTESSYLVNSPPPPNAPVATSGSDINAHGFAANWNAVSGATKYYLDVYTKTAGTFADDLFISEYVEGTGYNKAIEIFNGTDTSVDLSEYVLKKQINGAGDFGSDLALSGLLAAGDVYVIVSTSGTPNLSGQAYVDLETNSQALNYNGNDAVALYKNGTQLDVVGIVNQVAPDWGANQTFVRKAAITNPSTTFSTDDWDLYATDTFTYLGSHAWIGGYVNNLLIGYTNKELGDVTSHQITGLDPSTTYYYVVRAYNEYGTSVNSNEISVTTLVHYDYPAGQPIVVGDETITVTGGNANNSGAPVPPVNNASFVAAGSYSLTLIGAGPWTITIETAAPWGAYYKNGQWYSVQNVGGFITFVLYANKDILVPIVLGDVDPTLPVELSSFTATITTDLCVKIAWVAQSETNHSGYNILRAEASDLTSALKINPSLIDNGTPLGTQLSYSYTDQEAYSNMVYYYWLESIALDGASEFYGPLSVTIGDPSQDPLPPVIPIATKLMTAFPNPFNPNTNIRYSLKESGKVNISIYNVKGQLVRSFNAEHTNPGYYQVSWDGRDLNGQSVSSGIYMYRMSSGKYSSAKKMILAK